MTTRGLTLAALMLVSISACRYQGAPVRLQGSRADIAVLAGEWNGEYSSTASGRSGGITFTLRAKSDTAFGDVVMMLPDNRTRIVAADAGERIHLQHASSAAVLRVTFIHIDGGTVRGSLEPYVAPDCNCVVTTVFSGVVRDDRVIEGTYSTTGPGISQQGRWRVDRTR